MYRVFKRKQLGNIKWLSKRDQNDVTKLLFPFENRLEFRFGFEPKQKKKNMPKIVFFIFICVPCFLSYTLEIIHTVRLSDNIFRIHTRLYWQGEKRKMMKLEKPRSKKIK